MNIKKVIKLEFPAPFYIQVKTKDEYYNLLKDIQFQTKIRWFNGFLPLIGGPGNLDSVYWWRNHVICDDANVYLKFTFKFPRYYIEAVVKSSRNKPSSAVYRYQYLEYPSRKQLMKFLEK